MIPNPEVSRTKTLPEYNPHQGTTHSINNLCCTVDFGLKVGTIESSTNRFPAAGQPPGLYCSAGTVNARGICSSGRLALSLVLMSPAIQELSAAALTERTSMAPRPQVSKEKLAMMAHPWSPPFRHRSLASIGTTPPWALKRDSSETDSEVESYISRRSWHRHSKWHYTAMDPSKSIIPVVWPPGQWQLPVQCPFWNPCDFPSQAGSHPRR